jgi:hypothetical protein
MGVITIGKGRRAVSAGFAVGITAARCATTSNYKKFSSCFVFSLSKNGITLFLILF